ncbi:MAG TPA: 50S ribosomal protein L16 [Candidatus Norongarragalinales archaeon]|nr:50S ribosomal protein L16 [Candidatus Norongarragalinales archaeon]
MGIRPARASRDIRGQPWARLSKRKPRKSYVKGAPQPKVRQYQMGVDKPYELEVEMVEQIPVRIRDNSLEAARQAANKYLEKSIPGNYFFQIVPYPHLVLREHSALGVAGADRISKGMKKAFGRPKGRLAQLETGKAVMRARILSKDLPLLKEALHRATIKMPGKTKIVIRDISKDAANLAKKAVVFAKKEEEVVAAPTAAAEETAAAEGEKAAEGKGEAKEAKGGKK